MSTPTSASNCAVCADISRLPEAYVVHLSGTCCRCAEAAAQSPCGCKAPQVGESDCSALNFSVVVRRTASDSLEYEHRFAPGDFVTGSIPFIGPEKLVLTLKKHETGGRTWYSACVAVIFVAGSGLQPISWRRNVVADCCNIGALRRHAGNTICCWPKSIAVNGVPTPDYAPPPPEWSRSNPDDLNDADYWPALDMPLMQDSTEVPVRYFNGELQVRTKDVGSDGFGMPWGHTRIYSNRLSNSYDFGNGTNWLIHECPQLVSRKTDPAEVKRLHPLVYTEPTGCTLVFLRGTRNALWFDEFKVAEPCQTEWRPRFGAKHTLEFVADQKIFRLTYPNGHRWELYAFTPNCFEISDRQRKLGHDPRLNGKFIRHIHPAGHDIVASYKDGKLDKVERQADGVTEQFQYEYCSEPIHAQRIRFVTWIRGQKLRRAEYTYYGPNEPYGNPGDLKTARTLFWMKEEWKQRENSIYYYRYYKQPNDTYCQGLLQCVVSPETFHRLIDEVGIHPFRASDELIREQAEVYVEYFDGADAFTARRVKTISLFGGARTHEFIYNPKLPIRAALPPGQPGYNRWHTTTTEHLKHDAAEGVSTTDKIVCSNFIGQTKRVDLINGASRWTHFWEYDDTHAGLTWKFEPSAVSQGDTSASSQTASPLLNKKKGKVHQLTYDVFEKNRAFLSNIAVSEGTQSKPKDLKAFSYIVRDDEIYSVRSEISFGVGINPNGMQHSVLGFEYRWRGLGHMAYRKTTLPKVAPTHFHNAADFDEGTTRGYTEETFDDYGNNVLFTDLKCKTTVQEMDVPKGVPIREFVSFWGKSKGERETLVISYKSDAAGRITQALGPEHNAITPESEIEVPVRAATWYLYKDLSGQKWTAEGYASGGKEFLINPVQIQRYDRANRVSDSIAAVRTAAGRPTIQEELPQKTWVRWKHQEYNVRQTKLISRVYHKIPVANAAGEEAQGTVSENYHETVSESDIAKRSRKVTVHDGTSYETQFEGRGLPVKMQTGSSPTEMKVALEVEYDHGAGGGNGNITKINRLRGELERTTSIGYDFRDRQQFIQEADGTRVDYEYSEQNAVAKMTRSAAAKGKLAEKFNLIDVRGRVYMTQLNGAALLPGDKKPGPLEELTLYDDANQVIAIEPTGRVSAGAPLVTLKYDGLGRVKERRLSAGTKGRRLTYSRSVTLRNLAGDPILVTNYERFPKSALGFAASNEDVGNEDGSTSSGLKGAANGRVSKVATWYDPLGRRLATADYGSSLGQQNRPSYIPDPSTARITTFDRDSAGETAKITNPIKSVAHLGYDHAGRLACAAVNVTDGEFSQLEKNGFDASSLFKLADDTAISTYFYTPENKRTRTVFHNSATQPQTTNIFYGAASRTPADDLPPSSHLPREIVDAEGRKLQLDYNSLGEISHVTDANGTIHQYDYDQAGRIVADRVIDIVLPTIDARIRRIEYAYDEFGRPQKIESYDAAFDGKLINSVVRAYGSYNELLVEAQLHTPKEADHGARTANTDLFHGNAGKIPTANDSVPGHVAYYYDYPSVDKNVQRLRTTWYPGDRGARKRGRWFKNEYSGYDEIIGRVSHVTEVKPQRNRIVEYQYWGASHLYQINLINQFYQYQRDDGLKAYTSLSLNAKTPFSALDSLNRPTRQKWFTRKKDHSSAVETETLRSDLGFSYDFQDKLLTRQNLQTPASDDSLRYDRLSRVVGHDRGTLNALKTGIVAATLDLSQAWDLDQSGNWRRFQRQRVAAGGPKFDQYRAHSRSNHIAKFLPASGTPNWTTPMYDPAGNFTKMPKPGVAGVGYTATYDAWNRLTVLTDRTSQKINYAYDGLGRRIFEYNVVTNELRHFYYDQAGRVITEAIEQGGQRVLDREYLWDVNSPQQLVCRIRHNPPGAPAGTEEWLYALHDVSGNVIALVDEGGEVKERYVLDPQGTLAFLDPDFTVKTIQKSAYDWEHLLPGMRLDQETGLHFTGAGYYHAELGRLLPVGPVTVLPESTICAHVQDFPFGSWRPPLSTPLEKGLKWLGEQSPWIKAGIGVGAMLFAVVYSGALIFSGNPWGAFAAVGAICGGLQAGIGASMSGGDFGDVMLSAGLGAAFGAIAPFGGIGSLVGAATIATVAWARGNDHDTIATAWEWGGLVGGLAGGVGDAATMAYRQAAEAAKLGFAAKISMRRALLCGMMRESPSFAGAGVGAIAGYSLDQSATGALNGATLGMMAGSLAGAAARGAPGVQRAKGELESLSGGTRKIGVADFDPDTAARKLKVRAEKEFGITANIKVLGAQDWNFGPTNGIMGFDELKREVVYILNRDFEGMIGTMRHEMTHVKQSIFKARLFGWGTSTLSPFSSIGRYMLELEAHGVSTSFSSPHAGALATVLHHRGQLSMNVLWIAIIAGGTYEAYEYFQ